MHDVLNFFFTDLARAWNYSALCNLHRIVVKILMTENSVCLRGQYLGFSLCTGVVVGACIALLSQASLVIQLLSFNWQCIVTSLTAVTNCICTCTLYCDEKKGTPHLTVNLASIIHLCMQ